MKTILPLVIALSASLSACLPSALKKYRKDGAQQGRPIDEPIGEVVTPARRVKGQDAETSSAGAPARATIYAVDKQTYRFQLREGDVWDSALNVLLRNYNITIVDKQTGIIATEWDSYYLDSAVFRNKLSLRIVSGGRGGVDVTIRNSVERLRDAAQATGSVGAVWLPAEDQANEVARIVQNMAIVLNQPPPVLPPNSAVAKGAESTVKR